MGSSSNTALASLTATYTDSDADSESENKVQPKHDSEEELINSAKSTPSKIENRMKKKATLVSYNVDDKDADETQISEEESELIKTEGSDEDLLPPLPTGICAPDLQQRVSYLYEKIKNKDFDMSKHIQQLKSFRNPSIYEKLIEYCGINEFGTNYPPHIYDPTKWGRESFYEELAKVQKAEIERREKEKKEKTKVEIVSGTAKHVSVTTTIANVPTTNKSATTAAEDNAKRRKTKWDQVPNASITGLQSIGTITSAISGTKSTVIPAFGSLPKKPKL